MKKRKPFRPPIPLYQIDRLIEGKWQTWTKDITRAEAKGFLTALVGLTRVIRNEEDVTGELVQEICAPKA